jgi:hypothetical protein
MGFNVYMQGGRGAVLPDLDNPSLPHKKIIFEIFAAENLMRLSL